MSETNKQVRASAPSRKTSVGELQKKRTAYWASPEKFRRAASGHRKFNRDRINADRRMSNRERRRSERDERWHTYLLKPPSKDAHWSQQFRAWLKAQPFYPGKRAFARAVGVSSRQVYDWLNGKSWPDRPRRRKLHEITGLECFAVPRKEKRPERGAEAAAAAVLKALVVRCGLANRQVRRLTVSQIEENGIRMGKRLIAFGSGWHQVDRAPCVEWLAKATPSEFLFFQLKPVDRTRPTSAKWVIRMLRACGVEVDKRRGAHAAHFAEDSRRFGRTGSRLLRHLRLEHGLSKSGAREILSGSAKRTVQPAQRLKGGAVSLRQGGRRFQARSERVIRRGEFCLQVIGDMRRIKRLSAEGWGVAEIQSEYPALTAWTVRDALCESDRDTFNHPGTWGPVVGYARMVLAKHYGRDETTIKDWARDARKHQSLGSPERPAGSV